MDDGGSVGYGMSIAAAGNRVMWLGNNNFVGINTPSPQTYLHIDGDNDGGDVMGLIISNTDSGGTSDDESASMKFMNKGQNSAMIRGGKFGNYGGSTTRTGELQFYVSSNGAGAFMECMRMIYPDDNGSPKIGIKSAPESDWYSTHTVLQIDTAAIAATTDHGQVSWSQNVKMTTASTNSGNQYIESGAASQYVMDAGNMYWKYAASGSADGAISWTQFMASNTSGVISGDFNDTSDVGLKENITNLTGGLSIVKQLKPRNFDWKEDGKGTGVAGFIAQEVETILPKEVVGEDYDETETERGTGKALNVTGIVAHMAKAIQELEARITTLEG